MKTNTLNKSGLCLVSYDDNQTEIRHFTDKQIALVRKYLKNEIDCLFDFDDENFDNQAESIKKSWDFKIKMIEAGIFQHKYDTRAKWEINYLCDVLGESVAITNKLENHFKAA